jgi:hypothetical protein
MHCLLLPDAEQVDHKTNNGQPGDGLDNRLCNLRPATRSQNGANRSKRNNASSRFLGVSWNRRDRKFQTQITVLGKPTHLGYFDSEVGAARAYAAAARKHHGEFANLNFPDTAEGEQVAITNPALKAVA